jgi:hypothetical protein
MLSFIPVEKEIDIIIIYSFVSFFFLVGVIEYPIIIIGYIYNYIYNYIFINIYMKINEYINKKNNNLLKFMIMMNELEERKDKLTSGEYLIECNCLMKLYNKNMY